MNNSLPALKQFVSQLDYELDPFQLRACERLASERSVLVAAPTGSGKTTIAEFAVYLARRERNARVFYTTPIKALSNQKYREFCEKYEETEVGLLTGDVVIRADAPIVIMTTEVLRNMIYANTREPSDPGASVSTSSVLHPTTVATAHEPDALNDLAFVILDEVHYLADPSRGAVWEEILLHLPHTTRIVALSATVSNAEELGDWIHALRSDTDVIVSDRRPVPLYQHVLTPQALLPLYVNAEGELQEHGNINPELRQYCTRNTRSRHRSSPEEQHRNRRSRGRPPLRRSPKTSRTDIARALQQASLLPAIVFVFSRNGSDQAVRQCLREGIHLTNTDERQQIRRITHAALSHMNNAERTVLGVREWVAALERGIAAHHAGLLPLFKTVVEQLFQQRLIKLVFATETLALGINMPARAVVIERLDKFNGQERVPLTSAEYTQLIGRAGRRGIDVEGHAIVAWGPQHDLESFTQLARARSFPVRSSFTPTANMAVNLLHRMSRELARDTLERSFAQFQADRSVLTEAKKLRSAQESVEAYFRTAAHSQGEARKRLEERARKLRRKNEHLRRKISKRTATIARTFDLVIKELCQLEYLEGDQTRVTPWGEILRCIYGERDLLIAQCLKYDIFHGLNPAELAAMCSVLSYEPRRNEDTTPQLPRSTTFLTSYERLQDVWVELDDLAQNLRLPAPETPHAGLARAIHEWASAHTLANVLNTHGISAGDFVRWVKQVIDLLDQIIQAASAATQAGLDQSQVNRLAALARTAREAKHAVRRGIVQDIHIS